MPCVETELVNILGLARALRLPGAWLKAEAVAGRIPVLRAGRRFLFNVAAVRETLLRRAAELPAPTGERVVACSEDALGAAGA